MVHLKTEIEGEVIGGIKGAVRRADSKNKLGRIGAGSREFVRLDCQRKVHFNQVEPALHLVR